MFTSTYLSFCLIYWEQENMNDWRTTYDYYGDVSCVMTVVRTDGSVKWWFIVKMSNTTEFVKLGILSKAFLFIRIGARSVLINHTIPFSSSRCHDNNIILHRVVYIYKNMTYHQDGRIASVGNKMIVLVWSLCTTAMSELKRSAQSCAVSSAGPTWVPFAALQPLGQSRRSSHILSAAIGR